MPTSFLEKILVPVLDNPGDCEYGPNGHEAYLNGIEVFCRACGKKLGVVKPKDELGGQGNPGTP